MKLKYKKCQISQHCQLCIITVRIDLMYFNLRKERKCETKFWHSGCVGKKYAYKYWYNRIEQQIYMCSTHLLFIHRSMRSARGSSRGPQGVSVNGGQHGEEWGLPGGRNVISTSRCTQDPRWSSWLNPGPLWENLPAPPGWLPAVDETPPGTSQW